MSNILIFPRALRPIRIESKTRRTIAVQVLDKREPERTRWVTQRSISRSANFRALNGFDDRAARRGYVHTFHIRGRRLLYRFLWETRRLIVSGRIGIRVDGRDVERRPQQMG